MKFSGEARRLRSDDIEEAAAELGLTVAHVRTVIEVETRGDGFDSKRRPTMLFERHVFYRLLGKTPKRDQAVRKGLAQVAWGGPGSYPKSLEARWTQFMEAFELDASAALQSTSWGLGQIMGSEYGEAGYDSPRTMVEAFCVSERNQVMGMVRLIKARKLDAALRKFPDINACRAFALRYNGKAYEKNKYHIKLRDAFIRNQKRSPEMPALSDDGILRVGDRGERVKFLQQELFERGYAMSAADGVFGNRTRDAVLAWQADNDRPTDGTMDAIDMAELEKSPHRPISQARAEASLADLKGESTINDTGRRVEQGAISTAGVVGVAAAAEETGLLDQASNVADQADKASGIVYTFKSVITTLGLDGLMLWINQHRLVVIIVGCAGVYGAIRYVRWKRLQMHQKGESA